MATTYSAPISVLGSKTEHYNSAEEIENASKSTSPASDMAIDGCAAVVRQDLSKGPVMPTKVCRATTTDNTGAALTISSRSRGFAEVILDFGKAEGGRPFFAVSQVESNAAAVSFDVVYSESYQGIDHDEGDGPYFLFSNAMNTYRREAYELIPYKAPLTIFAPFAQQSQRYQKIILKTPNSSIIFSSIGFQPLRKLASPKSFFRTSEPILNRIFDSGLRTVEMCTLNARETQEAWQVTEEGTRVYGQHWAPCRQGTRWKDMRVTFEVKVDRGGASWGIHMVANGLIFLLDVEARTVDLFEGLSHLNGVFPTIKKASWLLPFEVKVSDWLAVETVAIGASLSLTINNQLIGTVDELNIHPLLGGCDNNSGSVAFGGPNGFEAVYRNLTVTDPCGNTLYSNNFSIAERERTLADFAVGTNPLACTIDGAKRDRATFGGDLYVMARAIYHSTGNLEAVLGSLKLLTSHQTESGYLGNLCPVQAPVHDSPAEPPTYAFYSLSYALLLVTAIKDYWMQSGDVTFVCQVWPKLEKLLSFTSRFVDARGLIVAPPPLSMDWFPLGGPVFGASTKINLAYLEALSSMIQMQESIPMESRTDYSVIATNLRASIQLHLWNADANIMRMGDNRPANGFCLDVQAYSSSLSVSPSSSLARFNPVDALPLSFKDNPRWDAHKVISPYAIGFLAEAYFIAGDYISALNLINRVWGPMTDPVNQNYSGGHWEAMNEMGEPFGHDTSLVHGWSTWPTFLLPRYLGGVQVLEAGWRKWRCAPVLAGELERINVGVMTPYGLVEINVNVDFKDGKGSMDVRVPMGTEAEVSAPKGWAVLGERATGNAESGKPPALTFRGREEAFTLYIVRLRL